MNKPEVGDTIHISELTPYGDDKGTHICTVVDVLSVQLRATYEVARGDGGWTERSLFVFTRDMQWDLARQVWIGKAG